jgi:Gas vesicle synthesis protein GvpL/GvpF
MPLHIYGVVRAGHPLPGDVHGVAGGPVRLVGCEDLAAPVTDIPEDAELGESDARAHLDVLIRLLEGGTVLPVRLGTVVETEGAACRDFIEPVADDFRAQLERFDGTVEVHLSVFDQEEEQLREVVSRDSELARMSEQARTGSLDEKIRVGELVAERLAAVRSELADQILRRLTPLSIAQAPRNGDEQAVLRWAFLLRRENLPAFDSMVDELRAEHQTVADLVTAGPLPPFSFVESPAPSSQWGW